MMPVVLAIILSNSNDRIKKTSDEMPEGNTARSAKSAASNCSRRCKGVMSTRNSRIDRCCCVFDRDQQKQKKKSMSDER